MRSRVNVAALAAIAILAVPAVTLAEPILPKLTTADMKALLAEYRRPAKVPDSSTNPMTPAKVELGKALFFDPRLSGSGSISCATCHNPSLAWADGLPTGYGYMSTRLGRHTPTILNVAYGEPYFWDGRAATLEDQAWSRKRK